MIIKKYILIILLILMGFIYEWSNLNKEILTCSGHISDDWKEDGFLIKSNQTGKEYCVPHPLNEICDSYDITITVGSEIYFEFTQTNEEYAPPEIRLLDIREAVPQ